ncbi:MAG TPA: hypothetical protein VE135_18725 [Pyrinomonadaceae bacterium]|nr:hypothetical protein [Pyrinomonadaceae bacterium]
MKPSIKIIKRRHDERHNHDEDSNELKTSVAEKSVERSTREIASTVNGWIAELQKRKHAQVRLFSPLSVMLILIASISALGAPERSLAQPDLGHSQAQTAEKASPAPESVVKITIATVGSFFGPPTDHYRAGDRIIIAITMTNTSTAPLEACISSELYQDLPKLTKSGELVPYMQWQSYERLNAQRNNTCEDEDLPETVVLKPNESRLTDWFVLVDSREATGAEAWYDALPPGQYQLSIQRRLGCCHGPMVQSNKIAFEVVP